jgi:hypothetical protein
MYKDSTMKPIKSVVTIAISVLFPTLVKATVYDISTGSLRAHVAALADDSLEGRLAGSAGARMAQRYIQQVFRGCTSMTPAGDSGTYQQRFPLVLPPELDSAAATTESIGINLIGRVQGRSDTTIVIGAHYDHIGWGVIGSRFEGTEPQIHPGADDNASGVAALLELAGYFSVNQVPLQYSLEFVAFAAEEIGGIGSQFYVGDSSRDLDQVRLLVNLDMLGHLRPDEQGLIVFGARTSAPLVNYLDSIYAGDMAVSLAASTIASSDHVWFHKRQIPAVTFFTGVHDAYNTPDDTPSSLDYDGLTRVTEFLAEFITHFNQFEGELPFEETGAASPRKGHGRAAVSLGITPDFVAEVDGLKVQAVSPDRPAELGGILPGDIIVKIGDKTVGNIYEYMDALMGLKDGDTTTVTVSRAGETVTLSVQF